MNLSYPRRIFLATACILGTASLAPLLPSAAQNTPSMSMPNSQTTPSSTPQVPTYNNSTTPSGNPKTPTYNNSTTPSSKPQVPTYNNSSTPTNSMKKYGTNSSLNTVDRQFAMKAAQSDLTEIKTSQLALSRSQNPQVLKYAREMIQAHTDSTNKLKPIAARLGLTMPTTLGAENQAFYDRLSRLSGTQFDSAYKTGQASAHARTQAVFQTELKQGQNSDLKAFANEILPVVAMHLQMAKSLTAMR
jgi:putative membrane protein